MTTPEEIARIAKGLTKAQRDEWARQDVVWKRQLEGQKQGNPCSTLCLHCYGRHPPPHWDCCPHTNLDGKRAIRAFPKEMGFAPIREKIRNYLMENPQ